jgi:hypothetical protein
VILLSTIGVENLWIEPLRLLRMAIPTVLPRTWAYTTHQEHMEISIDMVKENLSRGAFKKIESGDIIPASSDVREE